MTDKDKYDVRGIETERTRVPEALFEKLQCPVCGSRKWSERRFEGVFCRRCRTSASLKPFPGDRLFFVQFNSRSTRPLAAELTGYIGRLTDGDPLSVFRVSEDGEDAEQVNEKTRYEQRVEQADRLGVDSHDEVVSEEAL